MGLIELPPFLLELKTVKELNLENNPLSAEAIELVCKFVINNHHLKFLGLDLIFLFYPFTFSWRIYSEPIDYNTATLILLEPII